MRLQGILLDWFLPCDFSCLGGLFGDNIITLVLRRRTMFGWVKSKIQKASTDTMRDDLQRFIVSLQGASDDEIATIVCVACVIRLNLSSSPTLPPASLDIGRMDTSIDGSMVSLRLNRLISEFQKNGQLSDATGCMVWLHSVRALQNPELRGLGRQMWSELSRGFTEVDEVASEMYALLSGLPKNIEAEARFIPKGLEP